MGSYKDVGGALPFLTASERERELALAKRIMEKWRARIGDDTALRGVPLYLAFMHTGSGLKILENNSRPGDPEIINVLPILEDDFVDVCFKILEGNLTHIELKKVATVLTYKVPPGYGGYADAFPSLVDKATVDTPVDLSKANALTKEFGERIRIYPGSMEVRDNKVYSLKSRAVGVLGVGENIKEARQVSLEGVRAIKGGAMWNRKDIASKEHIAASISHMERLRRKT
jgi:phosphoribosylamine--glycine ligase